jgi:hypothetical protein
LCINLPFAAPCCSRSVLSNRVDLYQFDGNNPTALVGLQNDSLKIGWYTFLNDVDSMVAISAELTLHRNGAIDINSYLCRYGPLGQDAIVGVQFSQPAPQLVSLYAGTSGFPYARARYVYPCSTADTSPPVISILGDNPLTFPSCLDFEDPGATACDPCSGTCA